MHPRAKRTPCIYSSSAPAAHARCWRGAGKKVAPRACIPFILLSRKFQSQCQAEADTYVYSYPTLFYTSARNLSRAWIREWNRPEASEPTSKSKYAPFGLVERTSPSVTGSCPSPATRSKRNSRTPPSASVCAGRLNKGLFGLPDGVVRIRVTPGEVAVSRSRFRDGRAEFIT